MGRRRAFTLHPDWPPRGCMTVICIGLFAILVVWGVVFYTLGHFVLKHW
jgi:hypothetical protein